MCCLIYYPAGPDLARRGVARSEGWNLPKTAITITRVACECTDYTEQTEKLQHICI